MRCIARLCTVLAISLAAIFTLSACAHRPETPSAPPQGIAPTSTVLFIHGMYMTPASWSQWEPYFRQRGYRTLAPAWPLHDAPVEQQRARHPDPRLAALTLQDVVDHYRGIIDSLEEPPILIGHSMGGLVVQLLLQEGLGAGGVALHSAPPKGLISLRWSFLKSNWGVINPLADPDQPIHLDLEQFQYIFVNGMPLDQQQAAYSAHAVPESRRVGKGPTTDVAAIDFQRARPPLLLIGGGQDHIIPASLNRANYQRYKNAPAVTDFLLYEDRNHWTLAQNGWETVADDMLDWLQRQQ